MARLSRKYRGILILLFLLAAYYGLLFDYVMGVKGELVQYMEDNNWTRLEVGRAEYNETTGEWESKPVQLDLTGVIDWTLTLLLVFGPLLAAFREII